MMLLDRSSLALETHTILLIMKTSSLIYRLVITVGVILLAPGPSFAQTNAWRQLFNGKDMKGWEQVGPGKFVVEDGKLKTVGGMGMLLYPAEKFSNVVIRVVYTVADNDCNSGVFIRIPEKPADEWVAVNTGYEVQIDNGTRHVGGEYHCSGVLYSLTKALAHPQRKPGEWNELNHFGRTQDNRHAQRTEGHRLQRRRSRSGKDPPIRARPRAPTTRWLHRRSKS